MLYFYFIDITEEYSYCNILNLTFKVGMNEQVEIGIPFTLSLNKRFCYPRPVKLYKNYLLVLTGLAQ